MFSLQRGATFFLSIFRPFFGFKVLFGPLVPKVDESLSVLRCVAVCCSVLQCVIVSYSVLYCVAVSCGVLQSTYLCRSTEGQRDSERKTNRATERPRNKETERQIDR